MMTEFAVRNRRRHKRVSSPVSVKFRTCTDLRSGKKSEWDMVLLRNISAGGALFLSDKEIETGALMDFVINVPGNLRLIRKRGMCPRMGRNVRNAGCPGRTALRAIDEIERSLGCGRPSAI